MPYSLVREKVSEGFLDTWRPVGTLSFSARAASSPEQHFAIPYLYSDSYSSEFRFWVWVDRRRVPEDSDSRFLRWTAWTAGVPSVGTRNFLPAGKNVSEIPEKNTTPVP